MAKQGVSAKVRAYLARIGAKGGKHSSGAGGRAVWGRRALTAAVAANASVVRARWAKAKKA